MCSKNQKSKTKIYYMAVPPGTPYSIMTVGAKKFNLTIEELEIKTPPADDDISDMPKTLALKGSKKNLIKARSFIKEELENRIKELSENTSFE